MPIARDVYSLSPDQQKLYVGFLRKGDPASIAQAMTMLPCAIRDAERVKDALALLERKPAIDASQREVAKLDRRLQDVASEIGKLVKERETLLARRSDLQNTVGSLDSWRHAVGMARHSPAVAAALKDELQAAGIL